jgi:hypothetical protein
MLALCSFGTAAYAGALDRLRHTALAQGSVDAVFLYTDQDVADFFQDHPEHLAPGNRGYGWWAWKPYIILKTFDALTEGDTLVYCDACVDVLKPVLTLLPPGVDIGLFGLGGSGHTIRKWTHTRALKDMNFLHCPDSAPMVNAGIQMYRVSKESRAFLEEYLAWCSQLEVVADRPVTGGANGKDVVASPGFRDHRHDQSVLSVLAQLASQRIALFPDATQHGTSPDPLFDHHRILPKLPSKTAVITATTGGRFLEECMASVQAQTHGNIEHWIVVDGPEFLDRTLNTVKKFANKKPVVVLALPRNTGANGWNGHRIYGSVPFLTDAAHIAYLDDDNVFESTHLQDLALACSSSPPAAWAHSLRSIVDESGLKVCDDNCESLGGLCHTVNGRGDYLIDTSCYFLSRDLAIAVGPIWNARFRDPTGKPEPDREVAKALLAAAPHAVVRKHSVRYRVGNTARSVRAQFFMEGNAVRNHDFALKKDLYLFHFSEDATTAFFAKLCKPTNEVALDEWQPTLWRGLADEYNLIDGFANVPNIPHGATIAAALCDPGALPLDLLKARTDLRRVVYTLESPNIRHAHQWTASFLAKHFDVAMTYWRPLLAAPPHGLKVVATPHNCHHFSFSEGALAAVPWRQNTGTGRTVVMVAEHRPFLHGKYVIDSHALECMDPLRETYARGLSNLTVFGVGWDAALRDWPEPKPVLGHALHRSRDPRPAVDIKAAFVFDLIVENTDAEGYCSEKLYDALMAGCVPLYRGSSDPDIVPADCYVDITPFADGVQLQAHLDALTDDDIRNLQARILQKRESVLKKVGVEAFAACVRRAIA